MVMSTLIVAMVVAVLLAVVPILVPVALIGYLPIAYVNVRNNREPTSSSGSSPSCSASAATSST